MQGEGSKGNLNELQRCRRHLCECGMYWQSKDCRFNICLWYRYILRILCLRSAYISSCISLEQKTNWILYE